MAQFGVFGDLGSHKLDIIHYLTDSEVDEICTTAMTLDKRYDNGDFIDIEDTAISMFHMKNGLTGYMNVSWCNYGSEDNSTVIYWKRQHYRSLKDDTLVRKIILIFRRIF